jgi:hypothetical protein
VTLAGWLTARERMQTEADRRRDRGHGREG